MSMHGVNIYGIFVRPIETKGTKTGSLLTLLLTPADGATPSTTKGSEVKGVWVLHSTHASLQDLLTTAKKLVGRYGVDGMKICKIMDSEIDLNLV
jgi:hypothetical protein